MHELHLIMRLLFEFEKFIDYYRSIYITNVIFTKTQYNFQENKSIAHVSIDVTNQIYNSMTKKGKCLGVFLDLKRHLIQSITKFVNLKTLELEAWFWVC